MTEATKVAVKRGGQTHRLEASSDVNIDLASLSGTDLTDTPASDLKETRQAPNLGKASLLHLRHNVRVA